MASTITRDKKIINWGPIGEKVYNRTYSRIKADGTKETWPETVERVVDGNLSLVDKKFWKRNERRDLIELLLNFEILPAGRHLWVSGVKGRQFLFNCHISHWRERMSDHYAFLFDELMKGGGVGANYSNRFIKDYKPIKNFLNVHFVCDPDHADYERIKSMLSSEYHYEWNGCIPIEDSREGWVNSLVYVLDEAHEKTNGAIVFDVSRIRPYGAPIRSFGGTASGPSALIEMILGVTKLLNSKIGQKLNSLDHMNIDHMIARCVVAGNVRRSARMSIKYWKDEDIFDFINCKSDKARVKHWTTNISVEVDNAFFRAFKKGDEHAVAVYKAAISSMFNSGEPGFWNSSLSQHGEVEEVVCTNPCAEIILEPFENCCLGHVNLGAFYDNFDGAKKAFALMTRFLIRATFGDIYSPWQQEVVRKNRRIGVGFFGFQDWLCKQGKKYSECHHDPEVRKFLHECYQVVKKTAAEYSHQLRIPCPIKNTTIAPTGTIAKLAGTSEGAQSIYNPYFIQRMRVQKDDPILEKFKAEGVEIEECENEEEAVNTVIAKFYCKHPLVEQVEQLGFDPHEIVEGQFQLSIHDVLSIQTMLQQEWADNSISLTVNMSDDISKKELYHTLIKHLPKLKGTTVIRGAGDRKQPPYTPITKEQYDEWHGAKLLRQGIQDCQNNVCPIK